VDFEADAVSQPVGEGLAVAGAGDHVAGQRVALAAGHAGPQLPLGVLLRLQHQRVQLHQALVARLAQTHRAGHVRAVAAGASADVDLDGLALPDATVGRHRVRHAGVRAAGHDRREARPVGVLDQVQLDHAGDLPLGQPGLQALEHVRQAAIQDVDGVLHRLQLLSVLDDAQSVDNLGHRHQVDRVGQLPPDLLEDRVRQVDRFEAEPPHTQARGGLGHRLRPATPRRVGDDLEPWRLVLGLLGRARVGQQQRLARADQQIAGRIAWRQIVPGVAAEVVARLGLGDQQPVDPVRLERGAEALDALLGVAHAFLVVAFVAFVVARRVVVVVFFLTWLLTWPFLAPPAAPSARSRAPNRGGSPSCFRQRTLPRPMSTWSPPHSGQGSWSGRLNDTQSQLGQLAQP
jgi:hypothetical protein